jgi:hypothetical protein
MAWNPASVPLPAWNAHNPNGGFAVSYVMQWPTAESPGGDVVDRIGVKGVGDKVLYRLIDQNPSPGTCSL